MKINDAVFGAILAVLGAVVLVYVQGFPTIPGQRYGPGLFPGTLAAGFLVCGVLLIASGLRTRAGHPWIVPGPWMRSRPHLVAAIAIVAGVAVYMLAAQSIGFLIISPVLLFLWMIVLGVRPARAMVAAIITTLVIWYVFYKLLRVPLPWGLLTRFAF